MSNNIIYLPPDRLKLHPKNMRQYYPEHQVAEMAGSIKAAKGVWQALLVVASDEQTQAGEEIYLVFDGNFRLAGGRHLGAKCPLLKCEVFDLAEAEQMLAMVTTSKIHYPKDPISEAKHFRRLQKEEGYSIREIVKHTGVSEPKITGVMLWLDLEEEIQQLVGELKLNRDKRVAEALLSIPNSEARVKLAQRFAARNTTTKGIEASCRRMAELLKKPLAQTAETIPVNGVRPIYIPETKTVPRRTQAAMCPGCADLINQLAEEFCNGCAVNGLSEDCLLCPGVIEFIERLTTMTREAAHDH